MNSAGTTGASVTFFGDLQIDYQMPIWNSWDNSAWVWNPWVELILGGNINVNLYSPYLALSITTNLFPVHIYGLDVWLQSVPPLFTDFCMNVWYDVRIMEISVSPVISIYECNLGFLSWIF